ncbi:hypothetical protein PV04_02947 [Phialophora macrospora]|uniref:ABM domain-containing protein n=1 Tax=Phialophora macrospora TaxID=1851006 RepID=A0A0D2E8R1_9EURO|nr:hypothetical protein PV04_02947 [Phialophora macrospora]
MATISQIVRFVLPPSKTKASEFLKLRQHLAKSNGIRDQFFGYIIPVEGAGLRVRDDEMCWVIQWAQTSYSSVTASSQLKSQLHDLVSPNDTEATDATEARSLVFSFPDNEVPELDKALTAPISEFAIINLSPTTPKSDISFSHSMNKTFTDCYLAEGFRGGGWSYALNTNDTNGTVAATPAEAEEVLLEAEKRRLACYYLGWESIEHHHAYARTALFAEEVDKLAPHFAPGTGAWYVRFERHRDTQITSH